MQDDYTHIYNSAPDQLLATKKMITSDMTRKPPTLPVIIDNIPDFLKSLPWVDWKWKITTDTQGKKKWAKVPITPFTMNNAKTNVASTWKPFSYAVEWYQRHRKVGNIDGIGCIVSGQLCGVDLDDECPDRDQLVTTFGTYAEASPTAGLGYKVFGIGQCPGPDHQGGGCEIYDSRSPRWFAVTGHVVDGVPRTVEPCQDAINGFYAAKIVAGKTPKTTTSVKTGQPVASGVLQQRSEVAPYHGKLPDDEVILDVALAEDPVLAKLYEGDTGRNRSEADAALVTRLAKFCGGCPDTIDRLFRQSGLYREKWERDDYRERTLGKFSRHPQYHDWTVYFSDPCNLVADDQWPEGVTHSASPFDVLADDVFDDVPDIDMESLPDEDLDDLLTFSQMRARGAKMKNSKIWAVEKWVQSGKIGLLAGKAKRGKSTCVFDMAASIVSGTKWLGLVPTRQMPVLLVDYENEEDYWADNFEAMLKGKGVDFDDVEHLLYGIDPLKIMANCKPFNVDYVVGRIETIQRMTGLRLGQFFIDTARPAFNALYEMADWEWKNRPVRDAIDLAKEVVRRTNWGCVVIHHATKADNGPSGSGDWEGAVDFSISYTLNMKTWTSSVGWIGRQTEPPPQIDYRKEGAGVLVGEYHHKEVRRDEVAEEANVEAAIKNVLTGKPKSTADVMDDVQSTWRGGQIPGQKKIKESLLMMAEASQIVRTKGQHNTYYWSLFGSI